MSFHHILLSFALFVFAATGVTCDAADSQKWVQQYLNDIEENGALRTANYMHPEDGRLARGFVMSLLKRMGPDRDKMLSALLGKPMSDDELNELPDASFIKLILTMGFLDGAWDEDNSRHARNPIGVKLPIVRSKIAKVVNRGEAAQATFDIWYQMDSSEEQGRRFTMDLVRVNDNWHMKQQLRSEKIAKALRGFDVRAQVGEVFQASSGLKTRIAHFARDTLRYPTAQELQQPEFSLEEANTRCQICTFTVLEDTGTIIGELNDNAMQEILGGRIRFEPPWPLAGRSGQFAYRCESDIDPNFLPRSCK